MTVSILLGTLNGARYLEPQLASLLTQTYRDWDLILSDDGSDDETYAMLHQFIAAHGSRIQKLRQGPRAGFAANYLSMVRLVSASAEALAFCDQDDVWMPDKLEHAMDRLAQVDRDIPALYCARSWICDADLMPQRVSPLKAQHPCFANALVQSIAGANTMVVNRAGINLLQETVNAAEREQVWSHDWWLYQLISGAGGRVIYDPQPRLFYRQHDQNVIGENRSFTARLKRAQALRKGDFRGWIDGNVKALKAIETSLTPASRRILSTFSQARGASLTHRMKGFSAAGVHREGLAAQATFRAAAALNLV